MRGGRQGHPSAQRAREIGLPEQTVVQGRHRVPAHAAQLQPTPPLPDRAPESDEMFQHAGKKSDEHCDPTDPPRCRANKRRGGAPPPPPACRSGGRSAVQRGTSACAWVPRRKGKRGGSRCSRARGLDPRGPPLQPSAPTGSRGRPPPAPLAAPQGRVRTTGMACAPSTPRRLRAGGRAGAPSCGSCAACPSAPCVARAPAMTCTASSRFCRSASSRHWLPCTNGTGEPTPIPKRG